ncbi:hypothetical protein [Burkholderia gladioli]|uniref:hypothetical protein n=1 Tax=Burkholderia gladioli TaxID=28095 RepID=UPI00163FF1DD|nr:hypothetical protein [Burkholderia gladioli]
MLPSIDAAKLLQGVKIAAQFADRQPQHKRPESVIACLHGWIVQDHPEIAIALADAAGLSDLNAGIRHRGA